MRRFPLHLAVALEDCAIEENGQYGVEAHSDGITTAIFYVSGTTLMQNNPNDYDATHCCTNTYQNNTVYVGTGVNVNSAPVF